MSEEQKPFVVLRLCQTCGFWKITNTLLDAFALAAGTMHMCPEGCGELHMVESDEQLMLKPKEIDARVEDADER